MREHSRSEALSALWGFECQGRFLQLKGAEDRMMVSVT